MSYFTWEWLYKIKAYFYWQFAFNFYPTNLRIGIRQKPIKISLYTRGYDKKGESFKPELIPPANKGS